MCATTIAVERFFV